MQGNIEVGSSLVGGWAVQDEMGDRMLSVRMGKGVRPDREEEREENALCENMEGSERSGVVKVHEKRKGKVR